MTADEAKALMAGPLGEEMAKYPLRFCKAAFFGEPPSRATPMAVSNGSATLIDVGYGPFALTCAHVLEGYRRERENSPNCFFQIGNCRLDPIAQLVTLDPNLDVATIRLTADQSNEIIRNSNGIGESFYSQVPWPPRRVVAGDFVAFGGFPGDLRRLVSVDDISFGTYSSGAAQVTISRDDYFVCQFERAEWVRHFSEPEPATIRGLSGGPAFVLRHSAAGLMSYEFSGVIYEFSEDYELLYVRPASAIQFGVLR
jgi:Trypsin-like peptidase domain